MENDPTTSGNANNNNSDATISELELLAAEYVLGQLDQETHQATQLQLSQNKELRYWVSWWQQRLAPLNLQTTPLSPAADVWRKIQQRIQTIEKQPAKKLWPWQGFGLAMTAMLLVAVTAVSTLYINNLLAPARNLPTHYASFESNGMLSHVIERYADGRIACNAVRPAMADADQVLELWALVNSKTPMSLGVLPQQGSMVMMAPARFQLDQAQTTLAISVEPRGGSPTGAPTGPVVNTAKLLRRTSTQSLSF